MFLTDPKKNQQQHNLYLLLLPQIYLNDFEASLKIIFKLSLKLYRCLIY